MKNGSFDFLSILLGA